MKKLKLIFGCLIVFVMLSGDVKGKSCVATFSYLGDSLYCPGDSISFTITAHVGYCFSTYSWYKNGVLITSNHTASLTVTDTGTYYGKSFGESPSDLRTSKKVHIKYITTYIPTYNIMGTVLVCRWNSYTYTAPKVANATYTWSLPSGWSGTSNTNTITIVPTSDGTINVTISTECLTFSINPLSVTVNDLMPSVTQPIIGNAEVCAGSLNMYSISPITNATSYSWNFPAGWIITGILSKDTIRVTPNSTSGTIMVRGYNACGASVVQTLGVTANVVLTPAVAITSSETTICAGTNVVFNATGVNGGTAPMYNWLVNGTSMQNGSSATYNSSSLINGDVVSCVLTANNLCQSTASISSNVITILVSNGVPSVTITTPVTSICAGANATFTATPILGGTAPTYNWFKNGVSVQNSSSAIYSSSGILNNDTIDCVMTSNETCVSTFSASSNSIVMTVNDPLVPSLSISASANIVCYGTTVMFTATPINGGSTPTYNFLVNGLSYQNGTNNVFYHGFYTSYPVTCIMTSNQTCITSSTATSNAEPVVVYLDWIADTISILSGTNPMCSGSPITLMANVNYGSSISTPYGGSTVSSYQWKVNGINVGTNSPTYTVSSPVNGDIVYCTVSATSGCGSTITSTDSDALVVNPSTIIPSVVIDQTLGTNPFCWGAPTTFTATSANGGTSPVYEWMVNGVNTGINSATFSPATVNDGDVISCVLTSNAACVSSLTATSSDITMMISPSYSINDYQTVCSGDTVLWHDSAYTSAGNYTRNYRNVYGCDSVYHLNLIVNVPDSVTSNINSCGSYTLNSQTYYSSGVYTQTFVNSSGCDSVLKLNLVVSTVDTSITVTGNNLFANQVGASYQWVDCGAGFAAVSGGINQTYIATANGDYAVIVSNGGCVDTSSCASVFTVGVAENIVDGNIIIYPNPTNSEFTVSSTNKIKSVKLYNVLGCEILKQIQNDQSVSIDISGYAKGVYFVEVKTESGIWRRKVVRE